MKKAAPKSLTPAGKRMWTELVTSYGITDTGGLLLVQTACEASDRYQAARAAIERDGQTITDKFGQLKPHPLLSAERDARAAMLAALKALHLDLEPVKPIGRPGRPLGVTNAHD